MTDVFRYLTSTMKSRKAIRHLAAMAVIGAFAFLLVGQRAVAEEPWIDADDIALVAVHSGDETFGGEAVWIIDDGSIYRQEFNKGRETRVKGRVSNQALKELRALIAAHDFRGAHGSRPTHTERTCTSLQIILRSASSVRKTACETPDVNFKMVREAIFHVGTGGPLEIVYSGIYDPQWKPTEFSKMP